MSILCGSCPWIPSVGEVRSNPAAGFLLVKQYLMVQVHQLLDLSSSLPAALAGLNTHVISSLTLGLPSQRTQSSLYMSLVLKKTMLNSSVWETLWHGWHLILATTHSVDGPRASPDSQNVGSIYFVKCGIKNASCDVYSPSQLHAEADNPMLVAERKSPQASHRRKNMSYLSSWVWLIPLNRMSWAPVLTIFFFFWQMTSILEDVFIFKCVCFACRYVCVPCACGAWWTKRGWEVPKARVIGSFELPSGRWESNPRSLEKEYVFITAEPPHLSSS